MYEPCPVVALARGGTFGLDYQWREDDLPLGGPQCDANAFLGCLLSEIVRLTPLLDDERYKAEHGERNILQDAVFGFVTRLRRRCIHPECSVISDSLHNSELGLTLRFPDGHYASNSAGKTISLADLWLHHFGEIKADTENPCGTCQRPVVRQNFLEGEPPLLIIQLERAVVCRRNGVDVPMKIHS